jgi:Rieske Fe-S protein
MSEPSEHAPSPPVESPAGDGPPRRDWLKTVALGLSGAAGLAAGIPIIGYLVGPLIPRHESESTREQEWELLGPVDQFPVGQTRLHIFTNRIKQPWDGMTAQTGVYVRNRGKTSDGRDDFLVLAVNCTHLGCPVTWFPGSGLFLCPCHGGAYYESGARASGPPPKGLFHYQWRVTQGRLEVRSPHFPTLHDPLNPEKANA